MTEEGRRFGSLSDSRHEFIQLMRGSSAERICIFEVVATACANLGSIHCNGTFFEAPLRIAHLRRRGRYSWIIRDDTKAGPHVSKPHWRRARASDLAAIGTIAARIHPDLPEHPEVFAEKMHLFPDGCLVLARDNDIVGYGLSHPWMQHRIPPLDGFLNALPAAADCLYIHDVALLPECRGRGGARAYVAGIADLARGSGIGTLALVSVYATRPLWVRLGFGPVTPDAALRARIASYGAGATYMLRDLAAT
jgi:GNAT superfamily N-acetyltransferase